MADFHRLRWQVFPYNKGYGYKNSISNGCFFNMGARLARYTSNDTYAVLAEKAWSWTKNVGLIASNYDIYDGAHIDQNCSDINKLQFSYNAAVFTLGAANMYNYVCQPLLLVFLTNYFRPTEIKFGKNAWMDFSSQPSESSSQTIQRMKLLVSAN